MNNEFILKQTDLASRRAAGELRRQVERVLKQTIVVLDFSSVLSVSESYADELFGVLVEQYSLSWVFSRLVIRGARTNVLDSVKAAIRYRLTNHLSRDASGAIAIVQGAVDARRANRDLCAA